LAEIRDALLARRWPRGAVRDMMSEAFPRGKAKPGAERTAERFQTNPPGPVVAAQPPFRAARVPWCPEPVEAASESAVGGSWSVVGLGGNILTTMSDI
jgi:hypothetical protein